MTDFLCVGEPLITLTPPQHTSLGIAAEVHLGVGGAELNVALHLARLGVAVAYAGAVGRDPFGHRLRDVLIGEGVDCTALLSTSGPTGLYFKEPGPPARTLYYRSGSAGSQLPLLSDEVLAGIGCVHVTGVTFGLRGEIERTAAALCARPRSWRLSFDVNFRPALWSAAEAGSVLLDAARAADLVFVGRDEAEAVWGVAHSEQIRELLDPTPRRLRSAEGASRNPTTELVIKDGPNDVEVWADGRWWRSTPSAVEITEPVGAGDAFAAAYLAARLGGDDPAVAATHGHCLAAHVMSSLSDQGAPDAAGYRSIGDRKGRISTFP